MTQRRLGRGVAVVGAGMSKFGAFPGQSTRDLFENQGHTAPIMADWVGLALLPATRVEDACASSGVALREGILAIASGSRPATTARIPTALASSNWPKARP